MKRLIQKQSRSTYAPFFQYAGMIILLSLFFIGPLFTSHWIMVGESIDQILRVIELDRGIREGYLYPRWFGDLAGGFGNPYFVFYSPLIYYVSEVFHLMGFSLVTSLKFMIILGVVLSGVGMFLLAKSFWGNYGALVSAVAYIYVPYRMVNLYIRGDFAEAFAMAILPLILYFFYQLIMQKRLLYLLGSALSYAMLIFTHNCTALIFSGFLVCFVPFISLQNKSLPDLGRGLVAIIWAFGLSAIFWLPALWEKNLVNIHLIYSDAALDFHNNFVEAFSLLSPVWSFNGGIGGRDLPFQIGAPHILLTLFSLGYIVKLQASERRDIRQLSLFFLFFAMLAVYFTNASSVFMWENLPIMKYLQFPWRFLSLLSLFASILAGGLFAYFKMESKTMQQMFLTIVVIIIILSGVQYCRVKGYYTLNEDLMTASSVRKDGGTISAFNTNKMDRIYDFGEYLPKSVKRLPDKRKAGKVFPTHGKAKILDLKARMQDYEFVASVEESTEIVVGSFYYPSWKGRIDSKPLLLFTDDEGLIHLKVPKGTHKIEVFFSDTTIRKVAMLISLLSFFTMLAFILGSKIKLSGKKLPEIIGKTQLKEKS